jgi:hypothetical protein
MYKLRPGQLPNHLLRAVTQGVQKAFLVQLGLALLLLPQSIPRA